MGFIDIHCHILPGIDDGPADIKESREMARVALNDGISHIFATPHFINGLYKHSGRDIITLVDNLKGSISDSIEIFYGSDAGITLDLPKRIENGDVLTLNGSQYLLIELPAYTVPPNVDNLIFNLKKKGIQPIITHPERNMGLINNLCLMGRLKEDGAMYQLTAMSITGGFGREAKMSCLRMIKAGLVDFIASDAHDSIKRPPILSKAYKEVEKEFDKDTADRLFIHNPEKIVYPVGNTISNRVNAARPEAE